VVVAVANPRLWSRFCVAIGAEALEHDPRFASNTDRLAHRGALNSHIREIFREQTVDTLIEKLSAAGVPCGRVRTIGEVLSDPQLAARQMLVDVPTAAGAVKVPGNPIKLSRIPVLASGHPPALGEHTDAVRQATPATRQTDS
jgi:formyl-CoA transferase